MELFPVVKAIFPLIVEVLIGAEKDILITELVLTFLKLRSVLELSLIEALTKAKEFVTGFVPLSFLQERKINATVIINTCLIT